MWRPCGRAAQNPEVCGVEFRGPAPFPSSRSWTTRTSMHPTAESGLPGNESQRRSGSTYYSASYQPPGGGSPGVAGGAGGSAGLGGVGGSGGGTGAPAGYRDVSGGASWAPPSTSAVSADPWVQHAAPASASPQFPPLPEFPAPSGVGAAGYPPPGAGFAQPASGHPPQQNGFPPPIHEFPPPASGYPAPNGPHQQPAAPRPRR